MRRIKSVFFLVCMLIVSQVSVYATTNFELKAPDYQFTFEDEPISDLPFLSINDEYYVPVEGVAEFFGFHTEIDPKDAKVINLIGGNSENVEDKIKALCQFVENTNRKVEVSKTQIVYNGNKMQTDLLDVDGKCFVKVEDAAGFFGIYMYKDDQNKVIDFSTDVFKGVPQEEKKVYEDYLSKNALPIDLSNLKDQALLKSSGLDQYNIVLYGEHHAIKKNFEIELFLIKFLNKNYNVRHILIEKGYCDAQLLNRYLETGDISILENIMSNLKGTFAYSKDMFQFYRNIYEYNKSLPSNEKLVFIGVDIQHQVETGMDYLMSLLPEKEIPQEIKENIEGLQLSYEKKECKMETLEPVLKDLVEHQAVFNAYLGEAYTSFKYGLNNIIQSLECYNGSDDEFVSLREQKLIENFTTQYSELDQAKYFGIFGGQHTALNASEENCNLATYINTKYDETKGKVGSISAWYYHCQYMNQFTGESMQVWSQSATLGKMLAEATTGDYALFPLCKENSIFVEDGSSQSQQYLLLVKDSPAATIYQNNIKK